MTLTMSLQYQQPYCDLYHPSPRSNFLLNLGLCYLLSNTYILCDSDVQIVMNQSVVHFFKKKNTKISQTQTHMHITCTQKVKLVTQSFSRFIAEKISRLFAS